MLRNIGSNWFVMAVTGAATFILMPYNLSHLGPSAYGVWLVITALTAYLSLLQLGVPVASVRQMTQAIAAGDQAALNRVVSSCTALYLALGVAAAALGVPLLYYFEHAYAVPALLQAPARLAFTVALVQIAIGFVAYFPYAILTAHQAFVPKNILLALGVAARVLINLVLVMTWPSVAALAIVALSVGLLELTLAWGYVLRRYPAIRPAWRDVDAAPLRAIFGMGAYVFVLALGSQLAFQTSALVIGQIMTSADVVAFAVPNSLMMILMQFLVGIASVIMPLSTNLQTKGDTGALRALLVRWTKIALALSWCAALFLLVFGPSFVALWIKGAYRAEAGDALRILTLGYLILLPVRGVAVPMLMGLGHVKGPALATLMAGLLNLVLSIVWVRSFGLAGAAWATVLPNIFLAVVITLQVCRAVGVPVRRYVWDTLPRAMAGGLSGVALLGLLQWFWQPRGWIALAAAGAITVLLSVIVWTQLVWRRDAQVIVPPLTVLLPGRWIEGWRPWARS